MQQNLLGEGAGIQNRDSDDNSSRKLTDEMMYKRKQEMKELDQQPSLFMTLEMSDHLIYDKLEQRRFDPLTNRYHYVLQENIHDDKILERLVHKYDDKHPQIKKKLLEYRAFKQLIDAEYNANLVRINGEQDNATILKNMIQAIEQSF